MQKKKIIKRLKLINKRLNDAIDSINRINRRTGFVNETPGLSKYGF